MILITQKEIENHAKKFGAFDVCKGISDQLSKEDLHHICSGNVDKLSQNTSW